MQIKLSGDRMEMVSQDPLKIKISVLRKNLVKSLRAAPMRPQAEQADTNLEYIP